MARTSRRAAAARKSRVIRVDFTNAGQTRFTPPEDDYLVEITAVNQGESSSGNDQLEVDFKVLEGKHEGKQFRQWFSLVEQALWKLAGVLRSAGIDIPEEPVDLDLDDIVGRKLNVTIAHREYNGDIKADIADSSSVDGEDEEEEGKPAKRSVRGKKPADDEEEEPEEKPARRRRSSRDEPEEEPEEKKPAKRSSKRRLPSLSEDEVADMDEDELEDTIEKYSLDVDLSDHRTLRKKAAAVMDALKELDLLEE